MNPALFRTNLKTQLDALNAYTTLGVEVFRYPPGSLAKTRPTLWVNQIEQVVLSDFTLVGNQEKVYSITGAGYVVTAGATDDQWGTAESHAYTMISGLADQLVADPTVGTACDYAKVTSWSSSPSQDADSKRVYVDFEFTITARSFP